MTTCHCVAPAGLISTFATPMPALSVACPYTALTPGRSTGGAAYSTVTVGGAPSVKCVTAAPLSGIAPALDFNVPVTTGSVVRLDANCPVNVISVVAAAGIAGSVKRH